MELPSLDLLTLFFKLLPGFLAAAVFHALTPYPKRDVLDRIVAAMIFTLFAELGVAVIKPILLWTGSHVFSLGEWNDRVRLGLAATIGLVFGLTWSHAVNNGYTHRLLRKWGITKKSSLPTQWFGAFSGFERFVILHFRNGRRLMGWPREWPDEPESGHFLLERPGWVLDDATKAAMHQIEVLLVSAKDVEAVEFLRFSDDPSLTENGKAIQSATDLLAMTRKESSNERQECTQTTDGTKGSKSASQLPSAVK